ncbi:alpha-2-macroglobulin-like [Myripristis murdjan]|uniref:alpha-2-macroglobulin-like n=1 Tax=Myripristis murdjan TaxID=586833 RepID=UPI001175F3F9|nr:alpha-2-macroglobulin-like [Myripristis murdjan]
MGLPGIQTWPWMLCALLSWVHVGQASPGPHYMVAIPAVLEAGADTQFCASLLQPNETLLMTITLTSQAENRTLLTEKADTDLHTCVKFKVPMVQNQEVRNLEVEVHGKTFHSKEIRKVMIRAYSPMTFIQTDKPIYLPGQTVHFRVVSMDTKFRPSNELYNIIEIMDSSRNRIGQWLNTSSNGKIVQLSYSLSSEAPEGGYQVIVSIAERKIYHRFKVEKYVLPKFDVKIKAPEEISIVQEEVEAEICGKYTYGQPVPANVHFEVCRPLQRHHMSFTVTSADPEGGPDITAPCYHETKQTEKTGCATFTFKMSTFTRLDQKVLTDKLYLKAKVEEEGTGIIRTQGQTISLSYIVGKLSFIDTPKLYEQGSVVEGKVKAVHFNEAPIPDYSVYLFEGNRWSARRLQNLTTDRNGVASFSLSTSDFRGDITLHVGAKPAMDYDEYRTPHYESGTHTLSLVQASTPDTASVSSLEVKRNDETPLPCDKKEPISIKYTIAGETQSSVDVIYLILSRGVIVKQGHMKVEVQDDPVTSGEVFFEVEVSPDMAPLVQVVAYAVLPSETVIAHSADFSTEKCFSNKVSLEFKPSSAVPGEENLLQLSASPHSLCGISAVDQSVLIKESGKKLDADKMFDLLPVKKLSHIPYEVEDATSCLPVRTKRYVIPRPDRDDKDAYTVFQNLGMKMATNLVIRTPSCVKYKGREYYYGGNGKGVISEYYLVSSVIAYRHEIHTVGSAGPVGFGRTAGSPPVIETVRTFFPETWIWDLVDVGETGSKDVPLTVPDTITTWETEAFCLSPQGFGLAPRKEFTVFQPFFLELSLPYSIIRGEHFELKATVFNYLTSCIMVTVTPAPSVEYTLTPLSGDKYSSCLCANERKTVSWTMAPSVLGAVNVSVSAEAVTSDVSCNNEIVSVPERGRIDVVTRSLIVKPEGTEVTKAYNWLLCPNGETLTAEKDLDLPENIIPESAHGSLSVLGDILGRALSNLNGLLRMPYGCGEQNMALLAPNIYILEYLTNTNQMTKAIKEKATGFLTSGYQRQLNYKHQDGAYSTFGSGSGNTWLTAFVLKSFVKAKTFVYIDPEVIDHSKTWLEGKQQANGCFQQLGKLFNNRMKGGVNDEVTLSAYVTAALLEANMSVSHSGMNRGLTCLKESFSSLSNTYTRALLAYVFTLAGDMKTRALLLEQLDKDAVRQGGFIFWTQKATETQTSDSLSVEISAYVLLAKLSASSTSREELGSASGIVRWLASQQNSYGGFSSTQDTVVALQALALYSSQVFTPEGSSSVLAQSPSGHLTFEVDPDNKLLYQEKQLKDVAGKYQFEVKGTACVAVQLALQYNIPVVTDDTSFSIQIKPEADCSKTSLRPKVNLKLTSQYRGKESTTNMVILDIKVLSGFVPNPASLNNLKRALLVDRVEQEKDHILIYLKELLPGIPINHNLELVQELPMQNLKAAVVKIYDYYQPSDQAETEYTYPCAAAS